MKKIILFIVLFNTTEYLFAQLKEKLCIVQIYRTNWKEELYVGIDSGQVSNYSYNIKIVTDSNDKKRNFVSEARAFVFINSLGWKIVPLKPDFYVDPDSKIFIFRKEE